MWTLFSDRNPPLQVPVIVKTEDGKKRFLVKFIPEMFLQTTGPINVMHLDGNKGGRYIYEKTKGLRWRFQNPSLNEGRPGW